MFGKIHDLSYCSTLSCPNKPIYHTKESNLCEDCYQRSKTLNIPVLREIIDWFKPEDKMPTRNDFYLVKITCEGLTDTQVQIRYWNGGFDLTVFILYWSEIPKGPK